MIGLLTYSVNDLHLDIDATGLKVYGEGEWKVKKHGTDGKRRVWRKLHLAVDTDTHEIIAAELTLSGVTDAEVPPNLVKQTRRAFNAISGNGAYDTTECLRAIRVQKAIPLIPLRDEAAFWEKGIHAIWRLAARNSMGKQTKSGNRSMVTKGVQCQKPRCIV
ncbi:transposase [Vibrio fluvialis]|nr:transposase [Vibrio fluvialis]